jgi:branched-chain amino acid transport system substrate-binding protein
MTRSLLVTALAALALARSAAAQPQEVRVGVIYPLTGAAASTGLELRNAAQLAADIVNGELPAAKDLPLPLAKGTGLPHLGGAKVRLLFGDHQGNPQLGASEAERLVTGEKVSALMGCYFSNVTATASQQAERLGVPFVNADSTSATLTARGFKWFFRTTPHDELFVKNFFQFLKDVEKKKGVKVQRVALFNENTLFGTETTKLEERFAKEQGYPIVEKIIYPAKSTQLTSEVQRLKAANPDLILQSSYLGDAILSMKTYKDLGFAPAGLLANDAGFNDTEFLRTLGKDGEAVLSREVWALDLAEKKPLVKRVNDLLRQRHNVSFTGNSARAFTGMMTLLEAIDRAGSTKPDAIQKALRETDVPGDGIIMPWKGIKFDATGQNELGAGIIVQVQDGKYVTVWPFDLASKDVVWPMPPWSKRQ